MSDTIDNKVVSMKFDNKQFEQNIAQTMASLQKLQDSLSKAGSGKGLSDIQQQADKLNFNQMGRGIDGLSAKFVALSTVAITTLANITNRAVDAGINIAKSLTIGPIQQGFAEYELTIGSIQTMLANTARYGTKLPEVTRNLEELNQYADKTIYNFGDMTKNIGLFTNAGIKIGDATSMIQGFSNVAAASGTSSEGAAAAAYQLSQALSAGTIRLMDWRSLTNVGMGNKNMQDSLIQLGSAMGAFNSKTTTAAAAAKDFNGSLESKWLSGDIMEQYLKIMAGKVTPAQMKQLGLTEKQIEQFRKQAKTAEEAATKVRTFTQLRTTILESIGSGWSETFRIVIGDFEEATKLWTKVNDTLGPILSGFSDARNKLLKGWDKLGGREKLIEALGNAFTALMRILSAVKAGFRAVFPPATAQALYDLTETFANFTEKLKMGAPQLFLIKQVVQTFFSVVKVGLSILKGLASLVLNVFSLFGKAAGNADDLTLSIGYTLEKFNEWVASGKGIEKFFAKLRQVQTTVLTPLIKSLGKVADAVGQVLGVLVSGDFQGGFLEEDSPIISGALKLREVLENVISWIKQVATALSVGDFRGGFLQEDSPIITAVFKLREAFKSLIETVKNAFGVFSGGSDAFETNSMSMDNLSSAGERVKSVWDRIVEAFQKIGDLVAPAGKNIGEALRSIWDKFATWFKDADFQDLVALINTGFLIALYVAIRRFTNNVGKLVESWTRIGDSFATFGEEISNTLGAMQTSIKAGAILKIAIAIAILAASIIALGMLDEKALKQGSAAVVGALIAVTAVLGILGKLDLTGGKTVVAIAGAILIMSVAIRALVSSVKSLGKMNVDEMKQGMLGVAILVGGMIALITTLSLAGPQVAAVGATILAISGAMLVMGGLIALLGQMGEDTLTNGLLAVAGITALIITLVTALALAGSLAPVTAAGGAAMLLAAGAIAIMAKVVQELSTIKIASLITAMATMTAMVAMLGYLMAVAAIGGPLSLAGAGGILMIAIALKIMADAVEQLGRLPWKVAAAGLGVMLALIGLIALAGLTATVFAAPLLALGIALTLIGGAMLLAGLGMLAFSAGLTALATLGTAGFLVIASGVQTLLNLLPLMAQQLGYAMITFANVMKEAAPELVAALGVVLSALFKEIVRLAPGLGDALIALIKEGLRVIRETYPDFVDTGYEILLAFLKGLEDNISEIAKTVGNLIVAFIDELATQNDRILNAGSNLIQEFLWGIARESLEIINTAAVVLLTFLGGVEQAIRTYQADIIAAGFGIVDAIIDGMIQGFSDNKLVDKLKEAATNLANKLPQWMRDILQIRSPSRVTAEIGRYVVEGFAVGLRDASSRADMMNALIGMKNAFKQGLEDINQEIADAKAERDRLLQDSNTTYKQLAEVNKKIADAEAERSKLVKTRNNYNKYLDDERAKLLKLAASYETVTKKLEEAKDKLDQLKTDKASKYEELFNQYNTLPDISKTTGLQGYIRDTKKQTEANVKYTQSLDKLRALGLDDASYKKLLAEGVDAQSLVNQLANGGKAAVSEFNKTNKALEASAKSLATKAANELFDAGIKAAEGLVKGLQLQEKAINAEMDRIANYMVSKIKKGLGIKSPSRAFMEIAKFAVEGLVKGFENQKTKVGTAVEGISQETIDKMMAIIARIRKQLDEDIETRPVITPVVDMTEWAKAFREMNKADVPDISASALAKARSISLQRAKSAQADQSEVGASQQIIFNQTNNSPEALSTTEIYRQSKTLISQVKQPA